MGIEHLGNAQALAWFSFITPYLPEKSKLYFGYHSRDSFWKDEKLFEDFVKNIMDISGREIELCYPLRYLNKYNILKEFKDFKIPLSCFWTCEEPILKRNGKIVACGSCNPCITLKVAKYEFDLRKSKNLW